MLDPYNCHHFSAPGRGGAYFREDLGDPGGPPPVGLKPHFVQICCVLQWFLQRSGGGPLGRGVGGKVNLPPYKGSVTLDQGSADSSFSLVSPSTSFKIP